ncbi:mechanosensitive ion channel family protein [Mucilaginibacter corticis]|uniref:Mechanosensitive ion channel family protein n=1 Tax=Mucilaginibacter corticis TaxID=2597670 RepID=A0A556MX53_9SPHI|nr:mechanosensitive ion channel family protein [Mucilaginibacter corticis]TSJ44501.1 mechanosensitive ion channel family protein [Mucilaginibacter corticis]
MIKYLAVLLFFIAGTQLAFAQQDSIAQQKKDSVLEVKLDKQLIKVQQLSAERLADSLKKAELQGQMLALSADDHLKRSALTKELNLLRDRDSIKRVQQKHQVDSLRLFVTGFPVHPFLDTLFEIFTRQGSFLPKERADVIGGRIHHLNDDYNFSVDSLKLVAAEQSTDLYYKGKLVLSVSEQDALWAGTTQQALAARYKTAIGKSVIAYQKETSWETLLKESLLALLVIVVGGLLIYAVNRLFKWVHAKTAREKSWYSSGIKIRNFQLLDAARQLSVLYSVINVIKWLTIILVIYLALPVLFGIFPFTKDISHTLIGYILSPLKNIALAIWAYVPNLITIIVIVIVFRYVLKFFHFIKSEIEAGRLTVPGFYPDWANPTYQILRVLILAFMLIIIFPYLPGSDSGVFKGVSVFVGVLFTFGSAGALGNIVAGLVLTYMRAFKIGDRVKIGEVTGDVIGKSLLVTRIRTIQNEIISIPNSTVMGNHTVNYSSDVAENGLILYTTVTIGYDAPWKQVHQLLIDAALCTDMVEKVPAPYVLQTSLDDYYVSYRINAYTKEPNKQARIYSMLHANIQDKFNEAGVEIMSPHYKALRDGNATTIPTDYLSKDYQAPAFNTEERKKK